MAMVKKKHPYGEEPREDGYEKNSQDDFVVQESDGGAESGLEEADDGGAADVLPETREEFSADMDHGQEYDTQRLLKELIDQVEAVAKKQDRNDRQIAQTLRENANFQIQVRQGMQREIDDYKKIERKEVFVPVLRDLAMTFVTYQSDLKEKIGQLLAGEELAKEDMFLQMAQLQETADIMFDELREILEENGAEIVRSVPGDARKIKQCKIMRKIPTGDKKLHNTVARSTRDGVVLGRQVLCNEYVDVYVYDESLDGACRESPQEDRDTLDGCIASGEVTTDGEETGKEYL